MQYLVELINPNSFAGFLFLTAAIFLASLALRPVVMFLATKFTGKTKTNLDDKIFAIARKPIFWSIFLLGEYFLVQESVIVPAKQAISSLILSFLVIVWLSPLAKVLDILLKHFSDKGKLKHELYPLFKNISYILVYSLGVYFLFLAWGISLTAWLASAGIVGIAIGFAAKDTLANLISGIFILADSPYKIGDVVQLSSGEKGKVIEIGLRSTRIKTFDGIEITIPNSTMANTVVANETGTKIDKSIRLKIDVGICYECDPNKAEQVMLEIVKEFDEILQEPAPQVRVIGFGASSVDMQLRVWIPDPSYKYLKDKIMRKILQRFKEEGIEIPYTKMDVYLKKD